MAENVEISGYRFTTTSSGAVQVYGPGIPDYGSRLAEGPETLSPASFFTLASSPNLDPAAQNAMKQFGSSQKAANEIKTALSEPEPAPIPVFKESELNKPKLVGEANDDNQYDKQEAVRQASKENDATASGSDKSNIINKSFAGSTTAGASQLNDATGKPVTNKSVSTGPKPGKRLQNPLGNFSTYTYQLSLYMITPDAYNAFVESGRKNINALSSTDSSGQSTGGGAFLIAQSGGINNKSSKRAPGFDLDFYIDDLRIKSHVNGKSTQTASNISEIKFNIYEPFGFSLVTKLKNAYNTLQASSRIPNFDKAINASKQFFILGIRFQGYDKNGNIANAREYFSDDTFNQSSDASGVFERFYDLNITEFKFKINGSATTYNLTAVIPTTSVGMGIAKGRIDTMVPISASTVREALDGTGNGVTSLFGTLNATQEALVNNSKIEIANVYKVRFLGNTSAIEGATLASAADMDKKKIAMSRASKSSQVNDATSDTALPEPTKRLISLSGDTSIAQAIKKIIMQSSYLEDAMNVIYDASDSPDSNTNSPEQVAKKNTKPISWYNLSTELKVLGFDNKVGDFAYEITYVIQPYETPAAYSPYTTSSKYYGPHKRYEYWFTGKNSEIISYEQQMDNTFFNVVLESPQDGAAQSGGASVPSVPNKRQNQDRTGKNDAGNEAQNSYMTSLFDPGAYATARISILGDPDYLAIESPSSLNEVYSQFYGSDGYTINPNGGEVFIEINFNEAVDYKNSSGLMDVNQNILFWQYPKDIATKIKGVSYMVQDIESVFSKGKFTQNIIANINDFPNAQVASDAAGRQAETAGQQSDIRPGNTSSTNSGNTPTPSAGSATSGKSGYTVDRPPNAPSNASQEQASVNQGASLTTGSSPAAAASYAGTTPGEVIQTETGIVTNDDSASNTGKTQAGEANTSSPDAGREINGFF